MCFKEFQERIQGVLKKFQVAWHLSQLLKQGVFDII